MSDVAALIADLVRAGVDADLIGRTAAALAARDAVLVPDVAADRRREADRERKRLRKSAEFRGIDGMDPSPQESPQTPKEPTPSTPSTQQEKPLRGQKKASRLPSDWQLPDDWRQDALDAGLDAAQISAEAATMLDWSRSSPQGAKLDWRASWRNWCRRRAGELPRARGSPNSAVPSQADVFQMAGQRAADDRERQKSASSGSLGSPVSDLRILREG